MTSRFPAVLTAAMCAALLAGCSANTGRTSIEADVSDVDRPTAVACIGLTEEVIGEDLITATVVEVSPSVFGGTSHATTTGSYSWRCARSLIDGVLTLTLVELEPTTGSSE